MRISRQVSNFGFISMAPVFSVGIMSSGLLCPHRIYIPFTEAELSEHHCHLQKYAEYSTELSFVELHEKGYVHATECLSIFEIRK